MLTSILAMAILASNPPRELRDYLSRPDSSFHYRLSKAPTDVRQQIDLTSQVWQGIEWHHTILLQQPSKPSAPHAAILFITGDGPRSGDLLNIGLMAEATGMPVAMLFDIPNQPLFGMKEDDLMAHTFERYLATGDPSWPLLFPMTKSAIRAMDAVQAVTKGTANSIDRFIVTGASKRGWTTWLVGASGDPRVRGIAPMVIDNLNVGVQMQHQLSSWGKYSDQIADYTRRGLQSQLSSPAGRHLAEIIDPYSYRDQIRMPTLIVKAANDPYWTVDALDQYWNDLREKKWVVNVPNAGHAMEGGLVTVVGSIGAFARSVAGEFPMPRQKWKFTDSRVGPSNQVRFDLSSTGALLESVELWTATSPNLDFRPSHYRSEVTSNMMPTAHYEGSLDLKLEPTVNTAVFAQMHYRAGGKTFILSTPTKVFRSAIR